MNEEQRQKLVEEILGFSDAMMRLSTRQSVGELLHSDLTMAQMKAIYYLNIVQPAGATMSELAKALGISLSTTTGIVDRLVEQGLVERHEDAADRRHVLIQLSAKGVAQAEAFNRGYKVPIIAMLKKMSDRDVQLIAGALMTLREVIARSIHEQESAATEQ